MVVGLFNLREQNSQMDDSYTSEVKHVKVLKIVCPSTRMNRNYVYRGNKSVLTYFYKVHMHGQNQNMFCICSNFLCKHILAVSPNTS